MQGHNLVTFARHRSPDDRGGGDWRSDRRAAVALDAHTGEVLVLASKPDYDLNNKFVPRLPARRGEGNRRSPAAGSTRPSVAPTRRAPLSRSWRASRRSGPAPSTRTDYRRTAKARSGLGNKNYVWATTAKGTMASLAARRDRASSCDIYFGELGRLTTAERIAEEAPAGFHLDRSGPALNCLAKPAGWVIPDPAWEGRKAKIEKWRFPGRHRRQHVHRPGIRPGHAD